MVVIMIVANFEIICSCESKQAEKDSGPLSGSGTRLTVGKRPASEGGANARKELSAGMALDVQAVGRVDILVVEVVCLINALDTDLEVLGDVSDKDIMVETAVWSAQPRKFRRRSRGSAGAEAITLNLDIQDLAKRCWLADSP